MNFSVIASVACAIVLVVQVLSLQPAIHFFAEFSVGSVSQLVPTFGAVPERQPELADLARKNFAPNEILFVGDVMLARNVEFLMRQKDVTYPFAGSVFKQRGEKFIVGNFESAIPNNHVPTEAEQMIFSVDATLLPTLKTVGFTHFSLANNHSFDYGVLGLENTKKELFNNELITFGDPNDVNTNSVAFIDCGKEVVALVGLHALEQVPSEKEIESLLMHAGTRSDFQIVYVHWGTEYELSANDQQHALATMLITAGADLIVGHHPHVTQNIDIIDGVPVFYSLGNFIFDQYFSKETQQGLTINLDLELATIELIPVTSEKTISQPRLMSDDERSQFLEDLAIRSAPELQEAIVRGVVPLNSLVASSPKIAMIEK
jgi:hypothetical protein